MALLIHSNSRKLDEQHLPVLAVPVPLPLGLQGNSIQCPKGVKCPASPYRIIDCKRKALKQAQIKDLPTNPTWLCHYYSSPALDESSKRCKNILSEPRASAAALLQTT